MIGAARVLLIVLSVATVFQWPSMLKAADQSSLERFFGTYEGVSLRDGEGSEFRDLKVVIRQVGENGFAVDWQTTLYEPSDDDRRKTQSLSFVPQAPGSANYIAAADGLDVGLAPVTTPFQGAPLVWASLVGDILTVNVLTIDEVGGWVMQTYHRALTKEGMALSFTRVHNGEIEKRVWGALQRVEP